jgi:hypothetical protein
LINVFFRGYGHWTYVSNPGGPDSYNFDLPLNDLFCGIFSLSKRDEIAYKHTKCLTFVDLLLPCLTHPHSEFLRRVSDKKLYICETKEYITEEDAEHCFFDIDRSKEVILEIAAPYAEEKTEISETERNTMLKLIIGMAIDAYRYKPEELRNSLTGDKNGLSARLRTLGINISDDTIRKYLTEAKNLL